MDVSELQPSETARIHGAVKPFVTYQAQQEQDLHIL